MSCIPSLKGLLLCKLTDEMQRIGCPANVVLSLRGLLFCELTNEMIWIIWFALHILPSSLIQKPTILVPHATRFPSSPRLVCAHFLSTVFPHILPFFLQIIKTKEVTSIWYVTGDGRIFFFSLKSSKMAVDGMTVCLCVKPFNFLLDYLISWILWFKDRVYYFWK